MHSVQCELFVWTVNCMYLMDAGIRDVVLFCLQGGETNMSQADKTAASSHTFSLGSLRQITMSINTVTEY